MTIHWTIQWLRDPEEHNYHSALKYLTLLYTKEVATDIARSLPYQETVQVKAKDLFRASRLSPLPYTDSEVKQTLEKIDAEMPLLPILIVVDTGIRLLQIAEGYPRLSAVYLRDVDALIPCKKLTI
jgi:hypothetical protein